MTKQNVLPVLLLLTAAYPQHEFPEPSMRLYTEMLADLDDQLLRAAARDHIASSAWFPKISELRAAVAQLEMDIEGVPSPYEAWEIAYTSAGTSAARNVPELVALAVKQIGGWWQLRSSENMTSDRARFIDAYRELIDGRKQRAIRPDAVAGYIETKRAQLPAPTVTYLPLPDHDDLPEMDEPAEPFWNREPVTILQAVDDAADAMRETPQPKRVAGVHKRQAARMTEDEFNQRREAMLRMAERARGKR